MSEALKPCPFCGCQASIWPSCDHSTAWVGGCATTDKEGCIGCDLIWEDSEEDAVKAWNARAGDDTLRTVLDMLNSNASRDNIRRVIEAELGGE